MLMDPALRAADKFPCRGSTGLHRSGADPQCPGHRRIEGQTADRKYRIAQQQAGKDTDPQSLTDHCHSGEFIVGNIFGVRPGAGLKEQIIEI